MSIFIYARVRTEAPELFDSSGLVLGVTVLVEVQQHGALAPGALGLLLLFL